MNGVINTKNEWCCKYQKVKMNGLQQQSKLPKIQQKYSKNQTCLEKIEFRVTKIKVAQKN